MPIKLQQQENLAGAASQAAQGFGRISKTPPPAFDPQNEQHAACTYFAENGFVVLKNCLNTADLRFLNGFFNQTQQTKPDAWGLGERRKPHHRNQGLIFSQPLLDHPELDRFTRHPGAYPVVSSLLGGEQHVRFSEFNFRETPMNAGVGTMNFHHDEALADRLVRRPYMPCDWLCAIHYLTDVEPGTPSFCVVPRSNRFETLMKLLRDLAKTMQKFRCMASLVPVSCMTLRPSIPAWMVMASGHVEPGTSIMREEAGYPALCPRLISISGHPRPL